MLCQVAREPWIPYCQEIVHLYHYTEVLPMNKTKTVVSCKIFLSLTHSICHFSKLQKHGGVQLRLEYVAVLLIMSEEWELWLEVFSSVKKCMSFQILQGNYIDFHTAWPKESSWPFKQQKTWANPQMKHVSCPMPLPMRLEYSDFTRQRPSLESRNVKNVTP